MDLPNWVNLLGAAFPNLANEEFVVTEPASRRYNCIAYAAGDTTNWWEPTLGRYWPTHATRSKSIENLKTVFIGLGYEECDGSAAEEGYQKVAQYEAEGTWKHAAIQMPKWTLAQQNGTRTSHRTP